MPEAKITANAPQLAKTLDLACEARTKVAKLRSELRETLHDLAGPRTAESDESVVGHQGEDGLLFRLDFAARALCDDLVDIEDDLRSLRSLVG